MCHSPSDSRHLQWYLPLDLLTRVRVPVSGIHLETDQWKQPLKTIGGSQSPRSTPRSSLGDNTDDLTVPHANLAFGFFHARNTARDMSERFSLRRPAWVWFLVTRTWHVRPAVYTDVTR
jgi:hypothetical protein